MLAQDFLIVLMPATAILMNHIHMKCSEIIFALRILRVCNGSVIHQENKRRC